MDGKRSIARTDFGRLARWRNLNFPGTRIDPVYAGVWFQGTRVEIDAAADAAIDSAERLREAGPAGYAINRPCSSITPMRRARGAPSATRLRPFWRSDPVPFREHVITKGEQIPALTGV